MTLKPTYEELEQKFNLLKNKAISKRQSLEALRQSEKKLRKIFNNANDAILLSEWGPEGPGPLIEVNDTACRILGYSRDELMSLSPGDIVRMDNSEANAKIRAEVLTQGHATFERILVTRDGNHIPVEINLRVSKSPEGHLTFVTVRDITERKRA